MRRSVLVSCVLVAVAAAGPANAGDGTALETSAGVVFESYTERRPVDAEYLLAPLMDELRARGYSTGTVLGTLVQTRHSLSGAGLEADKIASAQQMIKSAHRAYINFEFDGAVESARGGLDLLMARPATIARQPELRDDVYLALITLGMACNRKGDVDCARDAVFEFHRSFPDREVSRKRFGPEGSDLFRSYGAELAELGRGNLQIAVEGADTLVFLNERYVGVGSQDLEVFSGVHRVYTQTGSRPGRVYTVEVEPESQQTLVVSREIDRVLHTDGRFVGFVFPSKQARETSELGISRTVGRAIRARSVILVGVHQHRGSPAVVVTSMEPLSEEVLRSAAVTVPRDGSPSASQLRSLAIFVAGGEPSSSIEVIHTESLPSAAPTRITARDGREGGISPAWRWSSWVAGAGALGIGGYLVHLDGRGTCDLQPGQAACPDVYETSTVGYTFVGVGVALAATGLFLWTLEEDEDGGAQTSIAVQPGVNGRLSVGLVGHF